MNHSVRVKDWARRVKLDRTDPKSAGLSDQDIHGGLVRLHQNLGHGSRVDMLRMLKLEKGSDRTLAMCRKLTWKDCPRRLLPRLHRTVAPKRTKRFDEELAMDLLEVTLA